MLQIKLSKVRPTFHFWIHIGEKWLCSQNQNKPVCCSSVLNKYQLTQNIQHYIIFNIIACYLQKHFCGKLEFYFHHHFSLMLKKLLAKSCFLPDFAQIASIYKQTFHSMVFCTLHKLSQKEKYHQNRLQSNIRTMIKNIKG